MANSACSTNISPISTAFIDKEGNQILSNIKAARYVDYINYLFGNVFQREYLDNDSFVTLSDFTDNNGKLSVAGSLNNLYGKVREELRNQIASSNFVALPVSTQEEIKNIVTNWKLFINYHSKYNAYIAIREEDLQADEDKETNIYDKKGNEHTEFSLLSNEIRTLFKFLPKSTLVKSGNNISAVPVINPVDGLPVRGDFENIFKLTLDALKGIKDENKFIEKLTSPEVLHRIPELYFLLQILPVTPGTPNLTNKQRLLFHKFFQVMSRDYIPVWASKTTTAIGELPVNIVYPGAKSNVAKIEKQFISNFASNQDTNEYLIIDDYVDELNPENSLYGVKRLVGLPAKPALIDLNDNEINSLSPRVIKTKFKEHFDIYRLIGIEFSDFTVVADNKNLIKILNHALSVHDNISARLDKGEKLTNPLKQLEVPATYTTKPDKTTGLSKVVPIYSLRNILKEVYKFEGTISKISPTLVTKAANGENQSDITYSNAISIGAEQLNSVSSLEELYDKSYYLKLKYNPLHKKSFIAQNIVGNSRMIYQIENYSGHTITNEDESISSDTKNLSDVNKFVSDFQGLLGWGRINTMQLESKAGYFALKFLDKSTDTAILPYPERLFSKDFKSAGEFTAQLVNYLHGEIDRIKAYNAKPSGKPVAYGEFFIFKNFANKEDLLKDKNSVEYKKAEEAAIIGINDYFNKEVDNLNEFIRKNNITNFVSKKILDNFKISEEVYKADTKLYDDRFLRTFIANDFVHNVEFGIFISGDPLFYKDYHKRLGGLSSTGTQPIGTPNIAQLFNSDQEQIFWNNYSLRGILNEFSSEAKKQARRDNLNNFQSAVLVEDNVKENTEYQKDETIDNYIYSVKLNTGKDISKEQAIEDLKINQISEKGIDVGDGQGYLNLDAARELSIKQGTYVPQQDVSYRYEALIFKQMLLEEKGEKLSDSDLKLLKKEERRILQDPDKYALPTLKQSYYGTISNESVEIDAKVFDKFALAINLPSVARNHPKLKALLMAMAKRQIHYVKYKSGTKGFVRHIFNSTEELANEKNELDILQSDLLKLQITPPRVEKKATKIPTQKIKLLFTNLFDKGEASDSVKTLRNKFINDLNNIRDYNRKNVLQKLGFETDDSGIITSWNKEKVIDALVSQVNLQKLPTPLLEALETNENGDFTNTIESSNIYQQLLNYVSGKLDSSLREFKVNGGDFVLISESMFETPLKYFRLNKGKTQILGCDCRVTLTKEYSKMLNLPDGKGTISTIERLNELLKDSKFVEKYKKELTIAFSRPPVQGPNSMGFATIVEFISPTAGNILQLPKEFMHQAGIDFDYDKEKVLIPSLTDEGLYMNETNLKEREKELKKSDYFKDLLAEGQEAQKLFDYLDMEVDDFETEEDFENAKKDLVEDENILKLMLNIFGTSKEDAAKNITEIRQEINKYLNVKSRQKSLLSNNLFSTIIQSLQQPEIYSELILPNTDSTVKPLALSNGSEINNLNTLPQGINVYSYLQNLKVFKLFNDAKALLGPFALHNVFMEMIAPLSITANLDYSYDNTGQPTRRVNTLLIPNQGRLINISSRYDINGNIKQHITSEFINATVDSAKDPYFANFMLSFDNINTFTFLMALNYPVQTIVDFTSSAVVRKYLDFKSKGMDAAEALNATVNLMRSEQGRNDLTVSYAINEDMKRIGQDNSSIINKLKQLKSDNSLERNSGHFLDNVALLSNFIAMEEHSRQFSNFKGLFKNDTNKTSSLYEIASKKALRNNVISNGMFNATDVAQVENNSTMSAFRNDDLIGQVLKEVFPIMSNKYVSAGLGDLFNEAKSSLKEVDKRILSQIITNDYLTTLLFSFGEYKDENFFLYGQKLITKIKDVKGEYNVTLLERIYKLRKNKAYPGLVNQFPVLEKILGEVSDKPILFNPVYSGKNGFNVLLNVDPNVPILEKEAYMAQFKQIIEEDFTTEDPRVKIALVNLIQDFFIAGITQSGFNKSGISFLEYAPVKFIQDLLNPALQKYNTVVSEPEAIQKYVSKFANGLFKYNNAKYFNIPKDDKVYVLKNTHLGKYLYIPLKIGVKQQTAPVSSTSITTNDSASFTNHTGGALGSDTQWDAIGREFGVVNHNHYWMTNKTPNGNKEISAEDQVEGQAKATIAARQMGRIALTHQVRDERLIRNWSQVKYADAIYAIGELIESGAEMNYGKKALISQVKGGTGYAVQMAINEGKPVFVFDQVKNQWFTYDNGWITLNYTPTLTNNFAGIGTREINPSGEKAIRDAYTQTFSKPNKISNLPKFTKSTNIITRAELQANPKTLYIFGDNNVRQGLKGQAKEMRGEPNAIGISTKQLPSNTPDAFMTDKDLVKNKAIITQDVNFIIEQWNTGKYTNVILPQIGVGLANLPEKAPQTWTYLQSELGRLERTINTNNIEEAQLVDDALVTESIDNEAPIDEAREQAVFAAIDNAFRLKTFEYKNKSIETEFELGEQQQEALKALVDFTGSNEMFMTLQGSAGTGKTTIIGYLQKYLGKSASFTYMAPTHAATAELAFATVKTGSQVLPSTLQSAITQNAKTKRYVFTQKITKRLSGFNPIFILDEASMIDQTDIDKLKEALEDVGGKIIFLGDEKQISKVVTGNSQTKPVSPAFTNFNQVKLTRIYRQSDNSLINMLSAMRQQTDFKLFKVENSDIVKFVNRTQFGQELVKDLAIDAENTVVVTYTNASVKGVNLNMRGALGRTGQTTVGDIVIGYLGYASKQIEKRNIANSISYKIVDIQEEGSKRIILTESAKLQRLIDMGIDGLTNKANTTYYQLGTNDSLTFDNLSKLDFDKNNQELSKFFAKIHAANLAYANKEISYPTYLGLTSGFSTELASYSVGDDYIYNPQTNSMEKLDAIKHKHIKQNGAGSLLFNKDIDYGHAITIHKSQGSTIDNVYFDSSSLGYAQNTPIVDNKGQQVTTEKMSLAYVAMSRSKKKLIVYEGENNFEMLNSPKNDVPLPGLDDIGFKKSCN